LVGLGADWLSIPDPAHQLHHRPLAVLAALAGHLKPRLVSSS